MFSKVLHAGEEAISVSGSDEYIFIAMSRQGMRLSHEEADELVEALMHGRTRSDGFTAADMMDARAEGFRDGQKAARDDAQPVAFAVENPDGQITPFGWVDIKDLYLFQHFVAMRDGYRFVYAYRGELA